MSYEHITGAEELQRRLLQFPAKLEARVMRSGLRAGAVVIKSIADVEVPRRRGKLAKSLRVSTRSRRGLVMASIKIGNGDVFYAHMVHGGTKAHDIYSRGRGLSFGGVFTRKVRHPGTRANLFMKRALDRGYQPAIVAIAAYIRVRLDQGIK